LKTTILNFTSITKRYILYQLCMHNQNAHVQISMHSMLDYIVTIHQNWQKQGKKRNVKFKIFGNSFAVGLFPLTRLSFYRSTSTKSSWQAVTFIPR